MNEREQELIIEIKTEVAALRESVKSAHKRIDENDELTNQIHKLATSIETLAVQLKVQGERIEEIIRNYDTRLKEQGERIGALEMKPAKRWESSVSQILSILIAAAMAFFLAKFN